MHDDEGNEASIAVAIPTVGRPQYLRRALASVLAGGDLPSEVLVIDQSIGAASEHVIEAFASKTLRHVRHRPAGLSLARNRAAEVTTADYIAFLDDDTEVPPDWLATLRAELRRFGWPDAMFGEIRAPLLPPTDGESIPVSIIGFSQPRSWRMPVHPNRLGYGGHAVLRRATLLGLGGFDPRLGAGADFRAAEDIDMSYRLLTAGARVVSTPALWAIHHQRHMPVELPDHFHDYNFGQAAFCAKHLRRGDLFPVFVLAEQLGGDLKMLASALRRRSRLRARIASRRAAGTCAGLKLGWTRLGPTGEA